jgi:DNA invertase Pin-like site-specific DNA recombinase
MLMGYARVSTNDQDTDGVGGGVEAAGCERIFREKASGGRWDHQALVWQQAAWSIRSLQ